MNEIRIPPDVMESEFYRVLIACGFEAGKARTIAQLFMRNSLEGVYTHGVNRFPRFVEYVKKGYVRPEREPVCKHRTGALEQWDGMSGPGPTNALSCTDRTMTLASQHGIGCVALAHTNHWMRGGAYGWKAAKAGFAFIGWTNTIANMPAWGAIDNKLGNNPFVLALPYQDDAIVLDTAMSQYSYGSMELYKLRNEKLPVPGGYDAVGNLSDDPEKIIRSGRTLPIGYWKGAGLSLLLDMLATVLSGGLSTREISKQEAEHTVSQVFIAIDLSKLHHSGSINTLMHNIIEDYQQSVSEKPGRKIRYPGARALQTAAENSEKGIPVLKTVWDQVRAL
jgi:3-dehydro-L-gulonate 2-dehydrogenase